MIGRAARWPALAAALLVLAACSGRSDTGGSAGAEPSPATTATAVTEGPGAGYRSDVYADPARWLCRPDLASDPCRGDLSTTVVRAGGATEVVPGAPAADPPVDCFYVYPTVNVGRPTANEPFDGDYAAETQVARSQIAPFSRSCRVFAPLYRQSTLSGPPEAWDVAYADVLDAWKQYLADDNGGRGVVLLGHSQGSGHLNRLIREEVDPSPAQRDLLIAAYLLGSGVRVPEGGDVGGDFAEVPACRSADQTGCVVSYASFRSTSPPPPDSRFGRPWSDGSGQALCTNPAALAGGASPLDPVFSARPGLAFAPGAADVTEPTTPYVALPGLVTGECVERNGFSYLEITVQSDPTDPRADDVVGDLGPWWGLHMVDVQLAMGDLLALVASQSDAWLADHG
ncbi:MAG: DUF3089 domain-containing protein [Acidimicrobiales bacterium]|nr:DUF3089 domain-containing protein [Acidimicrobiales bacterium]